MFSILSRSISFTVNMAGRNVLCSIFKFRISFLHIFQVLIWIAIPHLRGSRVRQTRNVLRLIILFQYFLRLYLIFPLSSKIIKATGVVTETAWAGAAYNLILYMLASHVSTVSTMLLFCISKDFLY